MEALKFLTEKRDNSIKVKWFIMENQQENGFQERTWQSQTYHYKA